MASVQDNLTKLLNTKNAIRQKIISLGVDVPIDTPFGKYSDFIEQITHAEFEETTTDQDLLQLIDLYRYLGSAEYEDHTYTDEELQKVNDLVDRIVEGFSEETDVPSVPEKTEPWLTVLNIGRTTYYPGDTFSLDGYIIRIIYPNGTITDVTDMCSFTPVTPLTRDDTEVTITCDVEGTTFTYIQAINIVNQLEYVESTGSQYVKLGILPSNVSRVEFAFEPKTVDGSYRSVFYTELNGSPYNGMGLRVHTAKTLSFSTGSNAGVAPVAATVNTRYDIDWDCSSGALTINGEAYTTNLVGSTASTELYLFANNVAGSPTQYGVIRLYYIRFYDLNGKLVRDLIPVKDANGKACLRNKVTNGYLYSASGTLVAGPEI